MLSSQEASRLGQVQAIDKAYPFYDSFDLAGQGRVSSIHTKKLNEANIAWVYPELLTQLNLMVGDHVDIGGHRFVIDDVISKDPGASFGGFSFAPKIVVGVDALRKTKLLDFGSRVNYKWSYMLPPMQDADALLTEVYRVLSDDEQIKILSHKEAGERMSQALTYVTDYLGLIALIALFLAGIGVAFLSYTMVQRKLVDVAILKSVGVNFSFILRWFSIQLSILTIVSAAFASATSLALLPMIKWLLSDLLPQDLSLSIPLFSMQKGLLLGLFMAFLFTVPTLSFLRSVSPAQLFGERVKTSLTWSKSFWFSALLIVLSFWGLAILQANSFKTAQYFVLSLCLTIACFLLVGLLQLTILKGLGSRLNLSLKLAVLNVSRQKLLSIAFFVALATGSLLINMIPQIQSMIRQELQTSDGILPSLFLFDIQEEQREQVAAIARSFQANFSSELKGAVFSPLVKARLQAINGKAVDEGKAKSKGFRTREDDREQGLKNRSYNLSFRKSLLPTESLVEGRWFSGAFDEDSGKHPEVSLEYRFSQRLGVSLGDVLTFIVHGVEISGKVVNLRRVKWASFQPNFFVQFQPGVLEDAPQSYLVALDKEFEGKKIQLQNEIVRNMPNVSVVDVSRTVERLMSTMGQMSSMVVFMAVMTLICGLLVVYAMAFYQTKQRARDLSLLKTLGMPFSSIKWMIIWEFLILGSSAAAVGSLSSILAAQLIAVNLFDLVYPINYLVPSLGFVVISFFCMMIAYSIVHKILLNRQTRAGLNSFS